MQLSGSVNKCIQWKKQYVEGQAWTRLRSEEPLHIPCSGCRVLGCVESASTAKPRMRPINQQLALYTCNANACNALGFVRSVRIDPEGDMHPINQQISSHYTYMINDCTVYAVGAARSGIRCQIELSQIYKIFVAVATTKHMIQQKYMFHCYWQNADLI